MDGTGIAVLVAVLGLPLLPAMLAARRGRSLWVWYLATFGTMAFGAVLTREMPPNEWVGPVVGPVVGLGCVLVAAFSCSELETSQSSGRS